MSETERLHRHDAIIRDSFRQQQQSVRDWVRLLLALGESQEDIDKLLHDLSRVVDSVRSEVANNRFRG